jgi:hypothetical protein
MYLLILFLVACAISYWFGHLNERIKGANPKLIFYGPHRCGCGTMICKTAAKQGGIPYNYPDEPIYPNTKWELHFCTARQCVFCGCGYGGIMPGCHCVCHD